MDNESRKVIIVTDGDMVAKRTIELAAKNIGGRCISLSAGNPTPISGRKAVELIKEAAHDPVVVMVDDRGNMGCGKGEKVLDYIVKSQEVEVLGVLAVASNTPAVEGIIVNESVTRDGHIVDGPVDKLGYPEPKVNKYLEGDTVDILNQLPISNVVGIGDIGKMDFADDRKKGAPITTKALKEILDRSGYSNGRNHGPKNQSQ